MNRAIQLLTLICLMCWGTSCSPNRMHENYLIEIDSLTYHYPDSAILCLRRLANIIEKQPIDMQKYYQLLTIKANELGLMIKHSLRIHQIVLYCRLLHIMKRKKGGCCQKPIIMQEECIPICTMLPGRLIIFKRQLLCCIIR